MKKWTLFLLTMFLALGSLNAQNKKMKIAVMDFKTGVGVDTQEVQGLSDMLINTLYESGKFSIIERSQLNHVLDEWDFQASELTNEQLVQVGRILGVRAVLVGTVNFLASHKNPDGSYTGEYNVDVRAVDVESGEVVTTAGATKKRKATYREMMEKIGKQLAKNLVEKVPEPQKPVIVEKEPKPEKPEKPKKTEKPEKPHFRKSGFTIRPELGLNIPLAGLNYRNDEYGYYDIAFAFSPSAELAIGYQAGPHFFFGIIGGYGGALKGYYSDYYYDPDENHDGYWWNNPYKNVDYTSYLFPVKADIRWYLIDHEYSFIIDLQGGVGIYNYYRDDYQDEYSNDAVFGNYEECKRQDVTFDVKLGFGFAVGNWEAVLGGESVMGGGLYGDWRLTFNIGYRFGQAIKRWW